MNNITDEFRMVLGGQPTPFFFSTELAKSHFSLPVVNDNEIVRNTSDRVGREIRFNLFCALQ